MTIEQMTLIAQGLYTSDEVSIAVSPRKPVCYLHVDVVSIAGGTITPKVRTNSNPVLGLTVWEAAAAISGAGDYVYLLGPGVGTTEFGDTTENAEVPLPPKLYVYMDHSTGDNQVYGVYLSWVG